MGDLTKDFSKSELTCKCGCGLFIKNGQLASLLQKIRDATGKPITVTSGTRCTYHNKQVGGVTGKDTVPAKGSRGGSKDSNHTHGAAADIRAEGIRALELHKIILALYGRGSLPELAGLGLYDSFCHIDVDPKLARLRQWDERTR